MFVLKIHFRRRYIAARPIDCGGVRSSEGKQAQTEIPRLGEVL